MQVNQLVLEYATPRAGSLKVLEGLTHRKIGLGVVNPRTLEVESPEAVIARVREALTLFAPEQIFLNPDCGFGTFANRPMNQQEIAAAKLASMVKAAAQLRAELGR